MLKDPRKLPPRATPNRCCIFGIDAAETSGFGFAQPSKHKPLVYIGVAKNHAERALCVVDAIGNARDMELPLVIVGEEWTQHGKWGVKQNAGTNARWGAWEVAIELAGRYELKSDGRVSAWPKVMRVSVEQWRKQVLGDSSMPRDMAKTMALARMEIEKPEVHGQMDDNAAEAGCIALWGRFSTQVWKLLPKSFQTP